MPSSVSIGQWDDVSYSGKQQWQSAALDVILEYVPELHWPMAGDVLNRMRNDGMLAGSLRAWLLPIRRAYWALDPDGCRPSVYRQVADDLGLPVLGKDQKATGARRRNVQWGDHLRVSTSLRAVFGHAPFTQAYDTSTGKARLAVLAERLPKTISRIFVDEQSGQIVSVQQNRWAGQPQLPTIDSKHLVWYVNDREGLGWRGRSLMREAYPYWLIKDEMLRAQATGHRRFNMGVPYIEDQPNASPQQSAENARAVQNYRTGDFSGGSVPNGATLKLAGFTGTLPDTLGFTRYLDHMMSTAFLTQWLNLGTTEAGARALAESFIDMFVQSVQDFGDAHAEQATAQIVVPLVNTNFGKDEPAPRIVCGNVGANHALTAASIALLYGCGALTGDPVLENSIREMYKLPKRDPNAAQPPPVPIPPPPEAQP